MTDRPQPSHDSNSNVVGPQDDPQFVWMEDLYNAVHDMADVTQLQDKDWINDTAAELEMLSECVDPSVIENQLSKSERARALAILYTARALLFPSAAHGFLLEASAFLRESGKHL